MQLYADENFPFRTVQELRKLGYDVLTAFEDDRANQAIPDEDVLARAVELGGTILSLDRLDFKRLRWANSDHFGIVICTEDSDRIRQARLIHERLSAMEETNGELIRICRPGSLSDLFNPHHFLAEIDANT